jgi:hypothetical protein
MSRANRHHMPGHACHITLRCHQKEFLLKFAKDRQGWIDWRQGVLLRDAIRGNVERAPTGKISIQNRVRSVESHQENGPIKLHTQKMRSRKLFISARTL